MTMRTISISKVSPSRVFLLQAVGNKARKTGVEPLFDKTVGHRLFSLRLAYSRKVLKEDS